MRPSRLLLRLEASIKGARTIFEADCLRAERVCYLARLGHFNEVRIELAVLHGRYDARPNAEISAWLNLAEGLTIYFTGLGSPTTDKLKRSLALCSAIGLSSLQGLVLAWIAQFDYVRVDMDSMARNVRKSLQVAATDHHSARSRACLVVAQALHLAGRPDLALRWYQKARDHAVSDGDDATTSALMHNMGWLRMMCLRQSVLTGKEGVLGGEHALMNSESTVHFDAFLGDLSWEGLKPILRAQILSLQGSFPEALNLYEQHLTATESEGTSRLQANLWADKAWCLAKTGQFSEARESASLAIASLTFETHVDDRAAAHSRLAQVFEVLADVEGEAKQLQLAREAWESYERLQEHIFSLIGRLTEDGTDSALKSK